MAVLDVRLAELLWRAVLTVNLKRSIVEKLLRCFQDAHGPSETDGMESTNKNYSAALQLAAQSLALRSAMRVPSFQDWYKELDIGGDGDTAHSRRFSNMQFFFLKEAHKRCPRGSVRPDADSFNIPVAHAPEFARAFGCPCTTRTDKVQNCTL